ncbi:hypothetical protein [Streptomyces sp. NPDC089795]|uniref:hypothetical protein n=1 Tax=Streptomyces sp. NPDC089795 TaxID=3155297 RepID=UPI0034497461
MERGSVELPTEILQAVAWDAPHRRDGGHGHFRVEIGSALTFTVESDRSPGVQDRDRNPRDFFGSPLDMFDARRQAPLAACALSVRTVVEVCLDGWGHRHESVGMSPTGAP